MSESNKWFRDKWNRLDKLKHIEDNWFDVFNENVENEILRKRFLSVPLASPIEKYYITSGYGVRKDPYTKRRAFHKGIDLGAAWGTDILVTASGLVSFVGKYGSYGNSVFVDHGFGIQTRYAHLSKIRVKKGQRVSRGDRIGDMGNSGNSTGTHLHYEVREGGKAVNPMRYIKAAKDVF